MLLDTEFREAEPALSPDGRWLAYTSNETGRFEIYVRPFPDIDDGKWQISTGVGFDTVWSPEGNALYFVAPAGLFVTGFETEPTVNFETPTLAVDSGGAFFGGTGRQYDIAPSGERFIVGTAQGAQTDDDGFIGLIVVENWFEELKARAPAP